MNVVQDCAQRCIEQMRKVLVGMDDALELVLVAMLTEGHVLLEGVPGVAKTLAARALARAAGGAFSRIQFTPDLMPSDVVGTSVFDLESRQFHVRKGPIFGNVVLADEINRAPAKTQSALLEAMQERQVSIDGTTYALPQPFIVIATQNPVEHEGTYPLPEASLDRFFFKVNVGYPDEAAEIEILERHDAGIHAAIGALESIEPVLHGERMNEVRDVAASITIDDAVRAYVVKLVRATREAADVRLGASPRAAVVLMNGARTMAAMRGRTFVSPDDVQTLLGAALTHRILLDPGAELDGLDAEKLLERVMTQVPVPR